MKISTLVLGAGLFVSSMAHAEFHNKSNLTIGSVGSEGHGKRVYMAISPNETECAYGGIYFREETEHAEVLSVALAAKMANKKVRIDYDQSEESKYCTGVSIYVQ